MEPAAVEHGLLQETRPHDAGRRLGPLKPHDAILFGAVGDPSVPDKITVHELLLPMRAGSTSMSISARLTSSAACRVRWSARSLARSTCSSTARTPRGSTPRLAGNSIRAPRTKSGFRRAFSPPRLRADPAGCIRRRSQAAAKKLASITKSNAQVWGLGLWDDTFNAVRKDYPDVESGTLLVDAAAMDFVRKPESFDVVVASNLFGDILTDLPRL